MAEFSLKSVGALYEQGERQDEAYLSFRLAGESKTGECSGVAAGLIVAKLQGMSRRCSNVIRSGFDVGAPLSRH
ncbi:hypothetical protein EPI10_021212 [Gossypium australe]|uniref:Uncharacterized protein n=1 Tax=Gossypium australe TaxID=47621 RepID=A0A5B6WGM3_9ROSI|nr:hypothetical protein EPI10_021212 [Gossypium australe]